MSFKKLIYLFVSISFFSCRLYAFSIGYPIENFPIACPPELGLIDEFYVGASVSSDAIKVRHFFRVPQANFFINGNDSFNAEGVNYQVYGGYGRFFAWFYLGGEVFLNYSEARGSIAEDLYHTHFTARESFGLSLLPGLRVNNTSLLYTRLDFIRSFFVTKETSTFFPHNKTTYWGNGLRFGLGLETSISDRLSIRSEGAYAYYGSVRSSRFTKYKVQNLEFSLGLNYRFFALESCA